MDEPNKGIDYLDLELKRVDEVCSNLYTVCAGVGATGIAVALAADDAALRVTAAIAGAILGILALFALPDITLTETGKAQPHELYLRDRKRIARFTELIIGCMVFGGATFGVLHASGASAGLAAAAGVLVPVGLLLTAHKEAWPEELR